MKKILAVALIVITALSPLAARTAKEGENRSYIGATVGYNGVRDSLPAILAKVIGLVIAEGVSGGHADTEGLMTEENALAMGVDTYFEMTPAFSMSLTGGVSLDFSKEGMCPAPFADMFFWGRLPAGTKSDFLMGAGLGTFNVLKNKGLEGYAALLLAMRYQMDVLPHMGWWVDFYTGWCMMDYGADGLKFFDGFTVMPGLRTGLSYSF